MGTGQAAPLIKGVHAPEGGPVFHRENKSRGRVVLRAVAAVAGHGAYIQIVRGGPTDFDNQAAGILFDCYAKRHTQIRQYGKPGRKGEKTGRKQDGRGRTKTGPDRGSDGGSFLSFSRSFLLQDELGATIATSEENASKETQ
ncbi:hypothetical protein CRV24_004360 [Beauveria bassiana]|nr:hypothetical protein CRV24_004360 [Beauveria bassiana]